MGDEGAIRPEEVTSVIRQALEGEETRADFATVGTVLAVGDGIARVYGIEECRAMELLQFPHEMVGIAMNLEEDNIGCVLMGEDELIREGDEVRRTERIASVPVGRALLGRVVDATGAPLDGRGPLETDRFREVERVAPGIVKRQPVKEPLHTGYKIVDTLTPIGRGQRELIIGDRQTGKSALVIDTIINQRDADVICVYVAIGQKLASIARTIEVFQREGVMEKTVVVAAPASAPTPQWYLAPYAGCAIGEDFMERGGHALVVYDDLSKHAEAYREISLLLRRPPGREAFPGDIFYLHSRLLERALKASNGKSCPCCGVLTPLPPAQEDVGELEAAKVCPRCGQDISEQEIVNGGSLTALPIVETKAGDISTYIPTNLISITDGQIFLEADLFHKGVRPAMNVGTSVSRVGSAAQIPAMKKVAGELKLSLAQYREMAAFAEFGTELDEATRRQLARGERLTELLKQDQYEPMLIEFQVLSIYLGTEEHLREFVVEDVPRFEREFQTFIREERPEVCKRIAETRDLDEETRALLEEAIAEFKKSFVPSEGAEEAEEGEEPAAGDAKAAEPSEEDGAQ
ncbi:MAG: F0F1 ATP synthase subunit alpha [Planctomycetota bacterium]|jgi:F-type H+-transporting ATPase subunit alpha